MKVKGIACLNPLSARLGVKGVISCLIGLAAACLNPLSARLGVKGAVDNSVSSALSTT